MIERHEGTFRSVGGVNLYYQHWYDQNPARAVLAIVHGLGSHSGHFFNMVQHLVPCGYRIYSFDLRGHGRSPGQRGYINTWAEFREDLRGFLHLIDTHESGHPYFLLGHSLGAVIALDYALRFPDGLQGIIASALPAGKVGIHPIKLAVGQFLSQVWPRFSMTTGIDQDAGSRDPEVVAAFAQDPLRHYQGTARLVTEFIATSSWLQDHAAELSVPLLMLHGGADRIALPAGSQAFYQQVKVPDKTRREYANSYHDIHNDINYPEVMADICHWLEQHLEEPSSCCVSTTFPSPNVSLGHPSTDAPLMCRWPADSPTQQFASP